MQKVAVLLVLFLCAACGGSGTPRIVADDFSVRPDLEILDGDGSPIVKAQGAPSAELNQESQLRFVWKGDAAMTLSSKCLQDPTPSNPVSAVEQHAVEVRSGELLPATVLIRPELLRKGNLWNCQLQAVLRNAHQSQTVTSFDSLRLAIDSEVFQIRIVDGEGNRVEAIAAEDLARAKIVSSQALREKEAVLYCRGLLVGSVRPGDDHDLMDLLRLKMEELETSETRRILCQARTIVGSRLLGRSQMFIVTMRPPRLEFESLQSRIDNLSIDPRRNLSDRVILGWRFTNPSLAPLVASLISNEKKLYMAPVVTGVCLNWRFTKAQTIPEPGVVEAPKAFVVDDNGQQGEENKMRRYATNLIEFEVPPRTTVHVGWSSSQMLDRKHSGFPAAKEFLSESEATQGAARRYRVSLASWWDVLPIRLRVAAEETPEVFDETVIEGALQPSLQMLVYTFRAPCRPDLSVIPR